MSDNESIRDKLSKRAYVGEQFSKKISLSKQDISEFALLCGDLNPLHHDPHIASESRFGSIIACGPHTTALFMSIVATHFSQKGPMLGLEFSFEFRSAAKENDELIMLWEVMKIQYKNSLNGNLIWLKGTVSGIEGEVLSSEGKVLVTDKF